MNSELERLSSFRTWNFQSSKNLTPSHLARVGFYLEEGNICCKNCAFAVSAIDTEDMNSFVRRHQDASPACSTEIDNVSINSPLLPPCDLVRSFEANSSDSDTLEIDANDRHVPTVHRNLDIHDTKGLIEILKNSFQRAQYHGLFGNEYATVRKIDRKNPDFAALQNEMTRLWTFYDWPADVPAKPDVLAKAGFFYVGEIDIVRCAFCKGCLRNWVPEDVPIEEHRKHFPDCSFVKNAENTNNFGKFQVPRSQDSVNVTAQRQSLAATPQGNNSWNHSAPPPRHPHMADESKRVDSFTGKIIPRGQNVRILAWAGFYYVGPQDKVKCFYCDGGLEKWQPSNEPWCVHARWFPDCKYLQAQRGDDFIREIQENYRQTQTSPLQQNSAQGLSSTNSQIGNNSKLVADNAAVPYHIEARMGTATVRAVIDLGYSRQLVRQVIQKQLVETGHDFSNVYSLAEAVIDEQRRLDRAIEQRRLPQSNGGSLSNTSKNRLPTKRVPASFQRHDKSAVTYHIEPQEVKARMETATVRAVIAMGYSRQLVRQVIQKQLVETGDDFSSKESLAEAVNEEQHERLDRAIRQQRLLQSNGESPSNTSENHLPTKRVPASFQRHDLPVLQEENRKLKEAKICQICSTAERNIVFLNCGHIVCCPACAAHFQTCPVCRDTIVGTVKTFL